MPSETLITVGEIVQAVERLAPPCLAERWDNVGLLVGDVAQPVATVLVALDACAETVAQAEAVQAELLVVHHPLPFTPLTRLVEDDGAATLIRRLVREGRSLLAAHTNLDSAPDGLNQHVAQRLGLQEVVPLVASAARPLLKLVVFTPATHADVVREAMTAAGAGHLGAYRDCTFSAAGTGTFRPGAETSPFLGTPGSLERVDEVRIETIITRDRTSSVLRAMLAAHPYEEVAYDLVPLEKGWPGAGLGRIGTLPTPMTAGAFVARVREVLAAPRLATVGNLEQPVRRVALCTGAGGELIDQARQAGADLFLTGEVKHHQALQAHTHGPVIVDAGHFATEHPAAGLLAGTLSAAFPGLTVLTAEESDPLQSG